MKLSQGDPIEWTTMHYQGSFLRDCRNGLFLEVTAGCQTSHFPVLIKISADKHPLISSQSKIFLHWSSKLVIINATAFIMKKNTQKTTIILSVWIKKIGTIWMKAKSLTSECKEFTSMLDTISYSAGTPILSGCVQWTVQMVYLTASRTHRTSLYWKFFIPS